MNEDSDQSDDSIVETKSGVKWKPELIRKLIQLHSDAENEVKRWIRKPNSIWAVVLKKFRRLGIVTLTEQDLENKWNSLVRSYNCKVSGISKKYKKHWPYLVGMHNALNAISSQNSHSDNMLVNDDENKTDQPPEWFLSYMRKKEAMDADKHEELRSMLVDIQHSQMANRRLILSIFKKL